MEFITHPAVTRIFAKEIEQYGIISLRLSDDEENVWHSSMDGKGIPLRQHEEFIKDVRYAMIMAKHEDEAAIDPHEDSDTIQAALLERLKK